MAEATKPNAALNLPCGMFVRGVVVSSSAKVFNRKDGSGKIVCVRHEIALQPGLVMYEVYPPIDGKTVRLDGESVVDFPRLPELQPITLRVLRWDERNKGLVIKEAERIG